MTKTINLGTVIMNRTCFFENPLRRVLTIAMGLALYVFVGVVGTPVARADAANVVGPTKCTECHKATGAVWEATHHFSTFRDMPRAKEGREIAKKMGFKRIKAGSLCLDCHFTSVVEADKLKPIAGISCESCHSGGKDWIKVHSEFSGKKKEAETADEANARWAMAEAKGMIRPKEMYRWAKNCYSCHTVPNEKLVNMGGHTPGSPFELVAWSQGEVRHNLWYTKTNDPASDSRKNLMYVVGQAIELETALNAVGKATEKKTYAIKMAGRASKARKRFYKIAAAVDLPEIKEVAKLAKGAKLKLNNGASLSKIAEAIAVQTQAIVANYDGSQMAGVKAMLPAADKYMGKAAQ